MTKKQRLNLGCGTKIRKHFINIDIRPLPGVDIVADVRKLPFEDESCSKIIADDILEHLPTPDIPSTLLHWYNLLAPGGKLIIKTPNLETITYRYSIGEINSEEMVRLIFGNQDYPENIHKTGFTPNLIRRLCHKLNIKEPEIVGSLPNMDINNMLIIIKR